MKNDCKNKYIEARKYCEGVEQLVLIPLRDLLTNESKVNKELEETFLGSIQELEEKTIQVNELKANYLRNIEEFEKSTESYIKDENKMQNKDKQRIKHRINKLMANHKALEKNYKNQVMGRNYIRNNHLKIVVFLY